MRGLTEEYRRVIQPFGFPPKAEWFPDALRVFALRGFLCAGAQLLPPVGLRGPPASRRPGDGAGGP
jgi:hypothetical protein